MKFSNLGVSTRLAVGFGVVLVGAAVLAAAGWIGIQRQEAVATNALKRDVEFAQAINKIAIGVQALRRYEKDMLFNIGNAKKVQEYKGKHGATRTQINELVSVALQTGASAENVKGLDTLGGMLLRYDGGIEQVYAAIMNGEITTAELGYKKVAEFRQIIRDTEEVTDQLFERADKQIDAVAPALFAIQRDVTVVLGVVTALVALGVVVIALITSRSITVPVAEAVRIAEGLAAGDLTQRVEAHSKDELGRLMRALGKSVEQLGLIVGRIKDTSDMVGAASREIAQSNVDMSSRTEEQASSLEEASASMQQMSTTVSQNAQNAGRASELADQATGVAVKGGTVVREAVQSMDAVTSSSKKIADIIGVIDGIAFQTNILALNAAVEAARAGDQGRGFAVVASEVRSLAHRSAGAAKEIKDLISDSVAKVDAGARQVNDAGATMDEIVEAVKKVSGLVAEISTASREQAQGIEQVTESVSQMEKVTQQNAAMVEEASAAATSLAEQSRALTSAVSAFRLGEKATVQVADMPAPASAEPIRLPGGTPKAMPQPTPSLRQAAASLSLARKGNGRLQEQWQEI